MSADFLALDLSAKQATSTNQKKITIAAGRYAFFINTS